MAKIQEAFLTSQRFSAKSLILACVAALDDPYKGKTAFAMLCEKELINKVLAASAVSAAHHAALETLRAENDTIVAAALIQVKVQSCALKAAEEAAEDAKKSREIYTSCLLAQS